MSASDSGSSTRAGAAEGCRWLWVILAGIAVSACTASVGTLPKVTALPAAEGFKMLRPGRSVTACRSEGPTAATVDLLAAAFARLLESDEEANVVLNARVESSWWSVGVYGRRCVTLTGDVARSATTILLPMPAEHGDHADRMKGEHHGH